MIAYLVLVHRYPEQFKRLFSAIHHPANHYLIHVDKRSGQALHADIADFLQGFPNAALLQSEPAVWGGYSLVDAELRAIETFAREGLEWEFFINLSGQDFPLKSQDEIHAYLRQHVGKDFMKIADQADVRPDTLHRIEDFVTESDHEAVSDPSRKRAFLDGVRPYIGNQWLILSRRFCEFLAHSPEVTRFKAFYRNTLIADEGFFQTVIMNTSYRATLVKDDKRAIDWVPMGTIKLRPRDYTAADAAYLQTCPHLFARKFDETVDSEILDLMETHLAQPGRSSSLRSTSHAPDCVVS